MGPTARSLQMPVLPPAIGQPDRKGSFVLDADGTLAGDVTDVFTGVDAAQASAGF